MAPRGAPSPAAKAPAAKRAAAPIAAPVVIETAVSIKRKAEEEDFPRGGDTGLTALEYKEAVQRAKEDASKGNVRFLCEFIYGLC